MISSDIVYDQRPTDKPAVIQLLEFMLQKEIHVTARLGAYSGDHNPSVIKYVVCVYTCYKVHKSPSAKRYLFITCIV